MERVRGFLRKFSEISFKIEAPLAIGALLLGFEKAATLLGVAAVFDFIGMKMFEKKTPSPNVSYQTFANNRPLSFSLKQRLPQTV